MKDKLEFNAHKLDYIDISKGLTPLGIYNEGSLFATSYGYVNTNWYTLKGIKNC